MLPGRVPILPHLLPSCNCLGIRWLHLVASPGRRLCREEISARPVAFSWWCDGESTREEFICTPGLNALDVRGAVEPTTHLGINAHQDGLETTLHPQGHQY